MIIDALKYNDAINPTELQNCGCSSLVGCPNLLLRIQVFPRSVWYNLPKLVACYKTPKRENHRKMPSNCTTSNHEIRSHEHSIIGAIKWFSDLRDFRLLAANNDLLAVQTLAFLSQSGDIMKGSRDPRKSSSNHLSNL